MLQNRIEQYQNMAPENQQLQANLKASTREIKALRARLDKIRTMVTVEEKGDQ